VLMLNRDRHGIPPVLSPRIDRLRLYQDCFAQHPAPKGVHDTVDGVLSAWFLRTRAEVWTGHPINMTWATYHTVSVSHDREVNIRADRQSGNKELNNFGHLTGSAERSARCRMTGTQLIVLERRRGCFHKWLTLELSQLFPNSRLLG
jgi:hypothetical protein